MFRVFFLFNARIKHSTPFNTQSKSKKRELYEEEYKSEWELGNYVNSHFSLLYVRSVAE